MFYIPGYDPFHPRRYRELYRKEGAAQAAISGYTINQRAKAGDGAFGWDVTAEIGGQGVEAQVDVLVWSDIVRGSMGSGIAQTYLQMARTAWIYVTTGALWRLMRLRKGPVIAALYPVGMLLMQLLLAVLAGALMWQLIDTAGPWLGVVDGGLLPAKTAGFACISVLLLRWFKARDNKLFAYYLMHDYAFSARWRGANPSELDARLAAFGDQIAAALTDDVDEVLVVGHSSGAHLAVTVLADLIRKGRVPLKGGPVLSFVSLGQVVPMMSFLPEAGALRRDLHLLSVTRTLTWVDVTAPGDGCAFALCDPVSVSGVADADKVWPLVFSAAFTQTLSPARWKALRWRFFRLHFQYLCAFDQPRDYDYFQITAGPLTLGARYAGRKPSRSRIDRALSPYQSMAA